VLFGLPDAAERRNRLEVAIPKLGSLIATRDPNGVLLGLNEFEGRHPPVAPVFWGFRIMVGVGLLMIAVAAAGAWYHFRRTELPRWYLRVLLGMTVSGWVATVAGWYVTEIGRQPWLVQGVLLARDAVADHAPGHVGLTLVAYLVTYVLLLVAFVGTLFHLAKKEIPTAS
jgi:cytochrome bd ubiquinol oxidase subunit I